MMLVISRDASRGSWPDLSFELASLSFELLSVAQQRSMTRPIQRKLAWTVAVPDYELVLISSSWCGPSY